MITFQFSCLLKAVGNSNQKAGGRLRAGLGCLVALFSWSAQANLGRWELVQQFESPQGTTLHLKRGSQALKLETRLFDTRFVRVIHPPLEMEKEGAQSWAVLVGKPCQNCLDEKNVFLIAMQASGSARREQFVHPGTILDPKTKQILWKGNAYAGKCLRDQPEGYFVFQQEKVDRRARLQTSFFRAVPGVGILSERLLEKRAPSEKLALAAKSNDCSRIEGRTRIMLAKPLDLTPRSAGDADQEDAEDDEDEAPLKGPESEKDSDPISRSL